MEAEKFFGGQNRTRHGLVKGERELCRLNSRPNVTDSGGVK